MERNLDKNGYSDTVVILGESSLLHFNLIFDEDLNGFLLNNGSSEQELAVVEPMIATGLRQINNFANCNGNQYLF